MIRSYLRDLINDHKPTEELNDNNNNSNNNKNNNKNNNDNDNNNDRKEQKIQLTMQNNCVSTKNFEDTCTIYTRSEPVEIFVGSNTSDVTDRPVDTTLKRFQEAIKTSIKESEFTYESARLLYYHFQRIDIRRAESYIIYPDWIVSKKQQQIQKMKKIISAFSGQQFQD